MKRVLMIVLATVAILSVSSCRMTLEESSQLIAPTVTTYMNLDNTFELYLSVSTHLVGVRFFYTIDGSTPSNASPEWVADIDIAIGVGSTVTVKAIAYCADYLPSEVAEASVTN